ncbi:MAG TPA: polymer-forming cytoskeletal protein [Peptococcaceae bacterium]|nr:polymer-forming cytoskeletal protein [Peptococcaceae bacterium]
MFGKKENRAKPVPKIANSNSNSNVTYLAADCEVKGSFISNGNARIDGKVEGTVSVAGDLAIGQSAVLNANIDAQTISLAGEVRGNIKAKDLLELSSTARLYGDINIRQLKIDQGARFVGTSTFAETEEEKIKTNNKVTANNNGKNGENKTV